MCIRDRSLNDVTIIALSGIFSRKDVENFPSSVTAVLVGESLMKSSNPINKILELSGRKITYVKICGICDVETAIETAQSGVDFIGLVFAKSRRKLEIENAKKIVDAIHKYRNRSQIDLPLPLNLETIEGRYTWSCNSLISSLSICSPLIVGVFADQDISEVNSIANAVGLDIVQLSGDEGFQSISKIHKPTIKAVHVGNEPSDKVLEKIKPEAYGILLDTVDPNARGGTGKTFDWNIAKDICSKIPVMIAGGLNPSNVGPMVSSVHPFAVDVSSGVETDGKKDSQKIRLFIQRAKGLNL
eukprot:TRINITY_DN12622_c0_g1_i1.p1 TRINITY_DN12622_c0_g1~~TRINITY_DN12622_c0_g1_i1.p1  ORF type:complete len:300 (+),score=51.58 TRINITY_DN12622_c0_g1_i1:3-902(+)